MAHVQKIRHVEIRVCSHDNRYRLDLHESERTFQWHRFLAKESSEKYCALVDDRDFEFAKQYISDNFGTASEVLGLS